MTNKRKENSHLIIPFGHLMSLIRKQMDILNQRVQNMLTRDSFSMRLERKFWRMLIKVIIAVYLLMDRPGQENLIQ
jgi:hypothetical protein